MTLNIRHKNQYSSPIPIAMQREVALLRRTKTKQECLETCYALLTKKYHGDRVKTITRLYEVFRSDLKHIWARNGFLHCTTLNYVMAACLIESGHFSAEDITYHWTQVNYLSPHQYLKVRTNKGTFIEIDIWGKAYGVQYGDHAHGFHTQ
jgi:hypothetical protein